QAAQKALYIHPPTPKRRDASIRGRPSERRRRSEYLGDARTKLGKKRVSTRLVGWVKTVGFSAA
ncbi:MAG TPA: hypothetical protein VFO87_00770, partial [Nitrospira sp.]|nr:hypothetical protein [Nitrospira sp.]